MLSLHPSLQQCRDLITSSKALKDFQVETTTQRKERAQKQPT